MSKKAGHSTMMGSSGRNMPSGMISTTDKPTDFGKTLKRLLKYFGSYKFSMTAVYIIAVFSTFFAVLAPKILSTAINSLEETVKLRLSGEVASVNFDLIVHIIGLLIVIYLLAAILKIVAQYIITGISKRFICELRSNVQRKLSRIPLSYFDRISHGEILSRVSGDVENIALTLQESVIQLITGMVTLVGIFVMMMLINQWLTSVVLLTIPLYFFVAKPIIRRAQRLFKKRQKTMGQLNGLIEEMYTGVKTVKIFGREQQTKERFEKINRVYSDAAWKGQFVTGTIMPITTFLSNFSYILICVISGIMFTKGMITLGSVAAFMIYVRQFNAPVNQITGISNSIQSSIASAERIFEILDEAEEARTVNTTKDFQDGGVVFDNVNFSYTTEKSLIENLSLEIKDGQTIAIVGPTGAGKTTLVNLLMRFYEVNSGEIRVGSVPIQQCTRKALREQIGMVLQDTWLFKGSVLENIRYGREGATDEECFEAAEKAQAHHFISTLPDGYNTILNEESSNISQGQKQLITIARALLHDPRILILDEATSNVDTLTEQRIQDGMNVVMQNRTCFVIAHRLSTIKNADKILVMRDGLIVEMGNHDTLLNLNGEYAELYQAQFSA